LAIDVLNSLFRKAGELGLLQQLLHHNTNKKNSLYAYDVAFFIKSIEHEMNFAMEILDKFREAFGLQTNLQKSCVIPIT
jgi:hypothetical protein